MNIADIAEVQFDAAPFWEAAKAHRLLVARCNACGEAHYYPREICPFCRADDVELAPASGRGTIYSLSVTERPDHRRVVAYVTLEEGPTMMTRIIDAPETIAIGDAVTVDFEASPDGLTAPVFRRT